MKIILFVYEIFCQFPLLIIGNVILLIIVGILDIASVVTITPVVDLLIYSDTHNYSVVTNKIIAVLKNMNIPIKLSILMILFLGFNLLRSIVYILSNYLIYKTRNNVIKELTIGTFEEFFNARWYFFCSNNQGTLINTFSREVVRVADAFSSIAVIFSSIVQILFYFAAPFYLTWKVSSISLLTAFIFVMPFFLMGRISYNLGLKITSTANKFISIIAESLSSAKVILGYGNQYLSIAKLDKAFDSHYQVALKAQTLGASMPILYFPLGMFVLAITLCFSRAIGASLSESIAVLFSLVRTVPLIGGLSREKSLLDTCFPAYEQVKRLRQNAKELRQISGSKIFTNFSKEIKLENVSFAYPGCKNVLNYINAKILKAKMTAFVGESGAGKSTLIDMLMGFYEPTTGKISFDNIPIESFDVQSLRKRIGYVPQECLLFNMSIRDNLLWSDSEASESDIINACRLSRAHDFIQKLPNGYDTIVGDRGVRLSGGEIQRLSLARAILRKPDLLILDEATSSLDSNSEQIIQQSVENIAKYTTIVIVAHRLSTIKNADYIYVLNHGTIEEEGRYKELTENGGLFAQMVQKQILM